MEKVDKVSFIFKAFYSKTDYGVKWLVKIDLSK